MLPVSPNSYTTSIGAPMSIDDREKCEILSLGIKLGAMHSALKAEHDGLASENRILISKITQLNMVHAAELNAAVDGYMAARNLIVEKVKAIIERLKAIPERHKRCGCPTIDTTPFQNIINEIGTTLLDSHYNQLKKYPEYSDRGSNKNTPVQEAVVPFPIMEYPLEVQRRIINITEEIDSIEVKKTSLRGDNLAKTQEIEGMIDFHGRYLEDLNRLEKLGKIKGFVERVRAIYNNISWVVPETSGYECNNCYRDFPDMSTPVMQKHRPQHHKRMQQEVNEKLNDVQEHVLNAVKALEALYGCI